MAESGNPEPSKVAAALLVTFVPSADREGKPITQDAWVTKVLELLGSLFGGATAFPKARGVWRDDRQGGKLLFDEPVLVQCYTSRELIAANHGTVLDFLVRLGRQTNQAAVGFVVEGVYMEIEFPLAEGAP